MKRYISHSEKDTKRIAKNIAQNLGKIHVIGLSGELGAGKTVFAQGFAKGLGINEKIISPTFVLIRQHKIPISDKTLYHIDLYRMENTADIKQLGLIDLMDDPRSIVLIEWVEKIKKILPNDAIIININKIDKEKRELIIK
ncbi:MAG: tRNA (adenosine(37)-N6)-threonylcarbamoyltransferase complex ATPase subunit type 1 TsaE [Candidatus Daviesbacteria bacterium]|nr:tRNA (adenosine(37)-N6)-threonylcarbamoyltransferase complex ATPase subunit type 1 TsaE [Candidatus Daviesbacteria bacterium]